MDIKAAVNVVWRRRWTVAIVIMIGLVVASVVFYMTPRQYQATSQVMIVGAAAGRDPSVYSTDMPSLALSTTVLRAVKQDLGVRTGLSTLPDQITAKVSFGSSVMPITFMDRHPAMAVRGANAVADELSQYYRQISGSRYTSLEAYLKKELSAKRQQLEGLDRKLQLAAIKDPYFADSNASTAIGQQVLTLEQQRDAAQATLIGDQAQAAAQARNLRQIAPIVHQEKLASDPTYVHIRDQRAQDAAQLQLTKSAYSAAYPGTPGLEDKVQRETTALAAAEKAALTSSTTASPSYAIAMADKGKVDAILAADRARVAALSQQISAAQAHLAELPGSGVQVSALRRDRDAADAEYLALSTKLTDTLALEAEAASVGSVEVIDRASVAQPAIGKHASALIAGAVLGFFVLGISLAFLLELTDDRIRTVAGVEALYGRPVLATVGEQA
ncbi:MAG: GumC family protein [Vulcanimicrobiaceae bacterium]